MLQLRRIHEKLNALRHSDAECQVFGASAHRYRLAPVLANSELIVFEQEFGVLLPDDYALFLTQLGNGGAGPGYGLYPLGDSIERVRSQQTGAKERGRPALRLDRPFPLTAAVADALIACRRTGLRGNFNPHVATAYRLDGIMDICHQGCSAYEGLVLSGEQRGYVWGSGGPGHRWGACGSGPGGLGFLAWYEAWLDEELGAAAVERRQGLK